MSHEIRTPMNGILGMTELALDTAPDPEQRECLLSVKSSADSLMTIINDILDFSKIEAGKLVIDPTDFDLRESLGGAVKALALRAHQKGLELIYHIDDDIPRVLVGDPDRLRQILINVVGNAVKFTDRGEIELSGSLESHSGGACVVHFQIRDTGPGVPAEKQQLIFQAFAQADGSTTRKYGGTGLGLTISSRLVSLMGGRMWVESGPGQGTTFHFTACFGVSAKAILDLPLAGPEELRGVRALVVDDNAANRRVLHQMLESFGMDAVSVEAAAPAYGTLLRASTEGHPFQVVLLDAQMPEEDGFSLAARIRATPLLATERLMMLSSSDLPSDIARCRQLGIRVYLVKPIGKEQLRDALLGLMRSDLPQPAPGAPPPGSRPPAVPIHLPPLRILLAEDNRVNQTLVMKVLRKHGHHVTLAADGQEALDAMESQSYDLVLMDIQMPVMGGFEATKELRARDNAKGRYTPVIALTARAMASDREECLACGLDGYVSKPIHWPTLFAEVERVLSGRDHPPAAEQPAARPAWLSADQPELRIDGFQDLVRGPASGSRPG